MHSLRTELSRRTPYVHHLIPSITVRVVIFSPLFFLKKKRFLFIFLNNMMQMNVVTFTQHLVSWTIMVVRPSKNFISKKEIGMVESLDLKSEIFNRTLCLPFL